MPRIPLSAASVSFAEAAREQEKDGGGGEACRLLVLASINTTKRFEPRPPHDVQRPSATGNPHSTAMPADQDRHHAVAKLRIYDSAPAPAGRNTRPTEPSRPSLRSRPSAQATHRRRPETFAQISPPPQQVERSQ